MPELIAVQVKGQGSGLAEEDVDTLAVGGGGVAGIAVFPHHGPEFILRLGGGHGLVPDDLAIGELEAEQMTLELGDVTGIVRVQAIAAVTGHVDLVAPDNRAGRARTGQGGLPGEVFGVTPGDRQVGFITLSIAVGTTKTGPVGGHYNRTTDQYSQQGNADFHGHLLQFCA